MTRTLIPSSHRRILSSISYVLFCDWRKAASRRDRPSFSSTNPISFFFTFIYEWGGKRERRGWETRREDRKAIKKGPKDKDIISRSQRYKNPKERKKKFKLFILMKEEQNSQRQTKELTILKHKHNIVFI